MIVVDEWIVIVTCDGYLCTCECAVLTYFITSVL